MAEKYIYPEKPLLLVDDEKTWINTFSFVLEYNGGITNLKTCSDSRKVMDILDDGEVSMILLDLTMPHLSGEDLLERIVPEYPDVPVVILSGLNQLDTAVRCMKKGAADYYVKTAEREHLVAGLKRLLAFQELQTQNLRLKESFIHDRLEKPDVFADIVTCDKQMKNLFRYIEALALSSEPVLITGESGAGKELIANAVHKVSRPEGPLVLLNVAGLDDNVFSDTLFGHARGAFTGADNERPGMIERATGGTLFLDEIGDLSPISQVKLLRFLQDGNYFPLGSDVPKRSDARIVLATNRDLDTMKSSGDFRKDLYYRLRAHHIHLPPLRDRKEDIPLLLEFFIEEASLAQSKKKPTPPEELSVLLSTYAFPGNIRELRAMVYDAISRHRKGKLSMKPFKEAIGWGEDPVPSQEDSGFIGDNHAVYKTLHRLPTLAESAELLVEEAIRRAKGNQTIAAGMLGITRQALSKRLKKNI